MRALLLFLMFTALTVDRPREKFYSDLWSSPLSWLGTLLFEPVPGIRLPFWDLLLVGLALAAHASPGARTRRARPLDAALLASAAGMAFAMLHGLVRGGSAYQVYFQTHAFLQGLLLSFAALALLRTDRDFRALALTLLAAALLRSAFGLYVYVFIVRRELRWPPPYLTTHDDSVLFVGMIAVLLAWLAVRRTALRLAFSAGVIGLLLLLVTLNQRRVAWVSLVVAAAMMYLAMRPGAVRRRIALAALLALPLLPAYYAAAQHSTSKVFAPARTLRSLVGPKVDDSAQARRLENLGLATTLRAKFLLGTGWGHEYIEIDPRYSEPLRKIFPQYRYVPHNSVLGFLAFTGFLGFSAIWAFVPVTLYLAARAHRHPSATPVQRAAGLAVVGVMATWVLQAWVDMGTQSVAAGVFLAACVAAAGRLSVRSGAWPGGKAVPAPDAERPVAQAS